MKKLRPPTSLTSLCLILSLTACGKSLPQHDFIELRFDQLPVIKLDIAKIEIVEKYRSPLQLPNVEHELPISPATIMRNWANDRLRAKGTNGIARFIIYDASVKVEALKKNNNIKASFTIDQTTRYRARLSAKLEVKNAGGLGQGFASAISGRQRTMPESFSVNERTKALNDFVKAAVIDFDKAMVQNIKKHLGLFLH